MFGNLFVLIVLLILVIVLIITIYKLRAKLKLLDGQIEAKPMQTDNLILALGQIPEGNYQSFITDPEGFAKAYTSAELITMMEKHKIDEAKECLKAAAEARKRERYYVVENYVGYPHAERNRKIALALEQRAQRLIDDENVFRSSAQLRATDDSA